MTAQIDFQGILSHFSRSQHLSAAELRRLQQMNLLAVLRSAAGHVPLYRDLYASRGISIDQIGDADALWRLPAVLKKDYLEAGRDRYVDERCDPDQLRRRTTSGSLGHSLPIYTNSAEAMRLWASLWAAWIGLGIGREDRLFMMSAGYLERPLPPIRSTFIPVQMPMDETIEQFRQLAPTAVIGSVESIALLAVELRRRDVPERSGVRRVFPFGQTLSHQLRGMIESGFPAVIFNLYGATETNWIGQECEAHDGLHVNVDRVIVQVAKMGRPDEPAAPGELGEVIVTSLLRRSTPFIRYRLEDAAAIDPSPCRCGRQTPRLKSLEGRVQDFLISTTGDWVAPGVVAIDLSAGQDAILDHRVVQEEPRRVRVSIVPGTTFATSDYERIEQVMRRHLGDVSVVTELVDEIPREPSGKRRRIFRAFSLE